MDLLSAMRVFVRVYETGSFSAAARQLQIGQPSLSKTIALLEAQLDNRLFRRSTRGLTPTEAGQRFHEHAVRTLDEAELAIKAVRGEKASLSGKLHVSGTITFMSQHIIPAMGDFMEAHPRLEITLQLDDGNVGLIEEGVDVAFRMGRLASSALVAQRIGRCRRVVLATPAYLARHGTPQTLEQLSSHRAIVFSRGEGGDHIEFSQGDVRQDIVLHPALRVSAMEGLRSAVLAGLGLAVASEWIFTQEIRTGEVREVLCDWSLPQLDLWAVLPGGRDANARARAFIAFVREQLAASPFGVNS
ncbi:MAG: LysR family transcriptional regulator [Massilia sp.]